MSRCRHFATVMTPRGDKVARCVHELGHAGEHYSEAIRIDGLDYGRRWSSGDSDTSAFAPGSLPADAADVVNHPKHYTSHPSGIECIQVTEHMGFCLGNAVKYLWRADEKGAPVEDLKKAIWYIEREIARRAK